MEHREVLIHDPLSTVPSYEFSDVHVSVAATNDEGLRFTDLVKEILKTTVNHVMRGLLSRSITGVHFLKVQQQSR